MTPGAFVWVDHDIVFESEVAGRRTDGHVLHLVQSDAWKWGVGTTVPEDGVLLVHAEGVAATEDDAKSACISGWLDYVNKKNSPAVELAAAAPRASWECEVFYIRSLKHERGMNKQSSSATWWGPCSRGYTLNLNQAGLYTREEAEAICSMKNSELLGTGETRDWSPNNVMVAQDVARELTSAAVDRQALDRRLRALEAARLVQ